LDDARETVSKTNSTNIVKIDCTVHSKTSVVGCCIANIKSAKIGVIAINWRVDARVDQTTDELTRLIILTNVFEEISFVVSIMITRICICRLRIAEIFSTEVAIITIRSNIVCLKETNVWSSCVRSRGVTISYFATICADASRVIIIGTIRNYLIVAPVSISSASSISTSS